MADRRFAGALAFFFLLAVAAPSVARGQAAPPAGQATAEDKVTDEVLEPSAPVVLDGETLFHVAGVRIYPAETRAAAIADRIRSVAHDNSIDPSSLKIETDTETSAIVAGSRVIVRLFENDARLERVPRSYLADIVLKRIREAIVRNRLERRPGALLRATALELGWAIALALALWITHKLLKRLSGRIEQRYGQRMPDVRIQSVSVVSAAQVWRLVAGGLRAIWLLTAVLVVLVYLRFALAKFPWTRGIGLALADLLLRPLQVLANGFVAALPNLIFLAVLAVITRYVLKLIRVFFDRLEDGRFVFASFEPDWAKPTYRIVRVLTFALAAVVAYPYIPGSSSEAFKGVSVFIGVVFSLGSTSIIGNALAGLSIPYRRAFRQGDVVKIGDYLAVVEKIRTLVTHLRTFKNEEVTVPNSVLLTSQVVNYSTQAAGDGLILHTTVGIGYDTPWRQVEAMLLEAADRVPGIRKTPRPFVLQQALADFCVTYELNVHCAEPLAILQLYSELHAQIQDVFNEYGVQIMTPAYMADPVQPKVVSKADWFAAPARRPERPAEQSGGPQAAV